MTAEEVRHVSVRAPTTFAVADGDRYLEWNCYMHRNRLDWALYAGRRQYSMHRPDLRKSLSRLLALPGRADRVLLLCPHRPGRTNCDFLANDGYTLLATSNNFTVDAEGRRQFTV